MLAVGKAMRTQGETRPGETDQVRPDHGDCGPVQIMIVVVLVMVPVRRQGWWWWRLLEGAGGGGALDSCGGAGGGGGLLVEMEVLVLHVVLEVVGGDCGGGVGCDAGR